MNWVKRYGCVVCKTAEITEQITEHRYEGDIPDVSNCDLSKYSDHIALGGKLFLSRPNVDWNFDWRDALPTKKLPMGGVCDPCLNNEVVIALVESGNLQFASEKDLPPRKW